MISNDERREVAARLRFTDHNLTWVEGCFCIAEDVGAAPTGNEHNDVLDFAHALADLIDRPTCRNLATHLVDELVCSACGERVDIAYLDSDDDYRVRYCPSCGAKVVE